jgi:hypothetical protein
LEELLEEHPSQTIPAQDLKTKDLTFKVVKVDFAESLMQLMQKSNSNQSIVVTADMYCHSIYQYCDHINVSYHLKILW